MKIESHIALIAALRIGLGVLGLLAGCLAGAMLLGPGLLVFSFEGDPTALTILGLIAAFVATLLFVLSVPSIIAGIGLLKRWPWARLLTMVLAAFDVVNVPVGTLIAVYTFWVLMQPQAEQEFSR